MSIFIGILAFVILTLLMQNVLIGFFLGIIIGYIANKLRKNTAENTKTE